MKLIFVKYIVFIYSYFWINILLCSVIEHSHYMTYIYIYKAFFWLVNISKNSILNQVAKFNLFMSIYFSFYVFELTLKDFPFYSPIFLTLWLHGINEGCKCLSSKLFFTTLNKSLDKSQSIIYSKVPKCIQLQRLWLHVIWDMLKTGHQFSNKFIDKDLG